MAVGTATAMPGRPSAKSADASSGAMWSPAAALAGALKSIASMNS